MYSDKNPLISDGKKLRGKRFTLPYICIAILVTIIIGLIIVLTIVCTVFATRNNASPNLCQTDPNNITQQNLYLHAAVSSDAAPCANVANNIMMVKGGNAVDGAIAGLLCQCGVNFQSCGIGGGALMVIYIRKGSEAYAIDMREQAPSSAYQTMFNDNNYNESLKGGKSIAVMGLVTGYFEIHQKLGLIEWSTLFQPTIELLSNGFYVTKSMKMAIDDFVEKTKNTSNKYKELWSIISDPVTGKPKEIGNVIKNPKLSKTLAILAKEPYAMMNGSLVDAMVREIRSAGGNITKEDLAQYNVKWRTPVSVKLTDEQTLHTLPPPASGALIPFMLNILAEYKMDSSSLDTCKKSGLFIHRFIETMKFAFVKRSVLGDMDFVNVSQIMAELASVNYAKKIKLLITDDRTHKSSYYNESVTFKGDFGTSHFSLLASNGDAVSSTATINSYFGSFVMGSETGILYNNQMNDFSIPNKSNNYNLPESPSNFIEPKKRPMSSMCPIIIVNKNMDVILVAGSAGGAKIISSVALISALATLLKREIKQAIDYPRVHNQLYPNTVLFEETLPEEIIEELKKRRHIFRKKRENIGIVQGIHKSEKDSRYIECNADFRKMGVCDGH